MEPQIIELNDVRVGDKVTVLSSWGNTGIISITDVVHSIEYDDDLYLLNASNRRINGIGDDFSFSYRLVNRPDPMMDFAQTLYSAYWRAISPSLSVVPLLASCSSEVRQRWLKYAIEVTKIPFPSVQDDASRI